MAYTEIVESRKRKFNRSLSDGVTPTKVSVLEASTITYPYSKINLVYPFEWLNSNGSGSSVNVTLSPNGAIINTAYGIAVNAQSPLHIANNFLSIKTDNTLQTIGPDLTVNTSYPLVSDSNGVSLNVGNGIVIDANGINVSSVSPCIVVEKAGISLSIDENTLSIENGKLRSKFYQTLLPPLSIQDNNISLKLDDYSLQSNSMGYLQVKVDSANAIKLSSNGLVIKSDDSLLTNGKLSVNLNPVGGITNSNYGLQIAYDPSTMSITQGLLTVIPPKQLTASNPLEISNGNISIKTDGSLTSDSGYLSVVPYNYSTPLQKVGNDISMIFEEPLFINNNGNLSCRIPSFSITASNPIQVVDNNVSIALNSDYFGVSQSNNLELNLASSSPIFVRQGNGGGMDIRTEYPISSINTLTLNYDQSSLYVTDTYKLAVRKRLLSGIATRDGIYVNTSSPVFINDNDQITLNFDSTYFTLNQGKLSLIPSTISNYTYMEYFNYTNTVKCSAKLQSGTFTYFNFYCNMKLIYSSGIVNGVISLNSHNGLLTSNSQAQPLNFELVLSPASYATDLSGFANFTFYPDSTDQTKLKFTPSTLYGTFKSIQNQSDWYSGVNNTLYTTYSFMPVSSTSSVTFGQSSMYLYPVQFNFASAPNPKGLVMSFNIPNATGNILNNQSVVSIQLPFIQFSYYAD